MTSYLFNDVSTNWTITAKTIQSKTGETLTLNGTNGTINLNSNGTTKAFVDASGLQIPDGNSRNATLSGAFWVAGLTSITNLFTPYAGGISRRLTLGALDTGTALTKYLYAAINKYAAIERQYISATDVVPLEIAGTDSSKVISLTANTVGVRPTLQLRSDNANGNCTVNITSASGSAPEFTGARFAVSTSKSNYYSVLTIDSSVDSFGAPVGGTMVSYNIAGDYTKYFGYTNEKEKSSVYAFEEAGTENRMDIDLNKISFKQGFTGSPEEVFSLASGIGTFGAGYGIREPSRIDTVTTGTTNLTTSLAFVTTINTPTDATRVYQLPLIVVGTIGYWYGICNKSTTFTIAIKNPSGTTIATVPVAPVTGGSSVARFAIDAAGTSYFAIDSWAPPTLEQVLTAGNDAQAPLTLVLRDSTLSTTSTIRGNAIELEQDDGSNTNLTGYTYSGIEHSGTSSFDITSVGNGVSVSSNMADTSNGYARLDLTSGNLTTTPPRAVLQALVDSSESPPYGMSKNILDLGTSTGQDIVIINGDELNELPENMISLHQDANYANNYIRLRSAYDIVGLASVLTLGIDRFTLSIANGSAITIGNVISDPVVFSRNISTTTNPLNNSPVGLLENSVVNATTTGTTILTTSNAFATIINTPTLAGRIFLLPSPTSGRPGFWYAICNKATNFTIAVQYPPGTIIATIPVAPSATNGGSVARFAVDASGTSYFAVDSPDRAITATNTTNVEITSDNTAGTYYIPFAKTSGTGNKPLFIDDVTTPFSYNPSTGTTSATAYTITGTPATASDASKFGQVGLVKITSVSVAITGSASSQNLSFANLFNSSYRNYRIILEPTTQVSFTAYPTYSLQAFLGSGSLPIIASLFGFEITSSSSSVVSPVYTSAATISSAPLIFAVSSVTNREIIFDIQNVGFANTTSNQVSLMCKSLYSNPGITGASDRTITCSSVNGSTITGLVIQQTAIGAGNNFTLEMIVYAYN